MTKPAPPTARFDLFVSCDLQSRDGSLTKGGLVRNGFSEKDREGEWMWARPALGTKAAAPVTGTGLGLYLVGTTLWGLYHNGTATSQTVAL